MTGIVFGLMLLYGHVPTVCGQGGGGVIIDINSLLRQGQ